MARPEPLPGRGSGQPLPGEVAKPYLVVKRTLDVALAAGVLMASFPLSVCAAVSITLEDGGPVLYVAPRVGLDGRVFRMLKFRTMIVNAADVGGPSTADDDPRLTRVGRVLRRWKLDELPQFLNVLRGDMSLVGPRPQVAEDVARYSAEQRRLVSIRPGITDWASIRFRKEGAILAGHADPDRAYDELIRPQKILLGLRYVTRRSLGTDLKIVWWTARSFIHPAAADAVVERVLHDNDAIDARPPTGVRSRFREITETGDTYADPDQFSMSELRHSLVAALAGGGDVLDIACGSGHGLPLIAQNARSVTACDRDSRNSLDARAASATAAVCLADAEHPPFQAESFDVIACLEAIYYFQDWQGFVGNAARLLRLGGTLVVSWPNPARPAFNPSPASTVYPSVPEFLLAAKEAGYDGTCYGAFPLPALATARPFLNTIRRAAVRLHLIPNSMRLRMWIKRVLYGRLTKLSEISLVVDPFRQLTVLSPNGPVDFAMLYFVGHKSTPADRG